MSSKPIVVVFGATGAQGSSVIEHLLKAGTFSLRAVTRDTSSAKAKALEARGVTLVAADVSKPDTYAAAFAGAFGAFVVTNFWDASSMGKELEQGKALAEAAKKAGVQQFVYSGLPNVEAESGGKIKGVPHFTQKAQAFDYIKTLGFKFTTSVGASFYYQNFAAFFPPKKDDAGVYVYTMPATSNITAFDVSDIGGTVASVFAQPARWNNQYLPSAGDHLSPQEYVDLIAEATGKKTKVVLVPTEQFAKFGFPGAEELAEMFQWFNDYTYHGHLAQREESVRAFPAIKSFKEYLASGAIKLE
jgi:uncharacterized protein YbjT (DUF2867 family)